MSSSPLKLAVIIGSTRQGRVGEKVGNWFARLARRHGAFDVDLVDLKEIDLPPVHPESPTPSIAAFLGQLSGADAFVIVTPEYNHSFPAALKHAIDQGREEWHAKPVGFASYGGMAGGLRAVEHLRHVFAELHAVTIRDSVSFHAVWDQFDAEGEPKDPKGCGQAAGIMLDQLAWWADALRYARTRVPYRQPMAA